MKRASARPSTLFLMELIISILFFSIAAAICVQFLAKSHTLSEKSVFLRNAEQCCTSIAEIISVSETTDEVVESASDFFLEKAETDGDSFTFYFDNSWASCSADSAVYTISTNLTLVDDMMSAAISASYADHTDVICSLDVCHHIQREVN